MATMKVVTSPNGMKLEAALEIAEKTGVLPVPQEALSLSISGGAVRIEEGPSGDK